MKICELALEIVYRAMPKEEGFTRKNVSTRRAEPDEEVRFFS